MTNQFCIWLLALLCTSCASAVKTRYYTLEPTQAAVLEPNSTFALGVGPISLPEHLEHSAVIALGPGNELRLDSDQLWAGDLKRSLTRVLALDLGAHLQSAAVFSYPWDRNLRPEHQLVLTVENLAGRLGAEVELVARWQAVDSNTGKTLAVRQQRFTAPTADASYNAYVAAINQVVGQWAQSLDATVREVWVNAR